MEREPTRFGSLLRAARLRAGLSQEDLAEQACVAARTIRNLELGRTRPRFGSANALAEALALTDEEHRTFQDAARADDMPPVPGVYPVITRAGVPAQLPVDPYGFTGRTSELAQLDKLLQPIRGARPSPSIALVSGTAGVGKSAVAVRWAHQARHHFADGQLYVNLRGFDPASAPMDPRVALRGFLHALDVTAARIPASQDDMAALFRSLVADRLMLIILDNAAELSQVRPLLPGGTRTVAVVTSRSAMPGLIAEVGADAIVLDVLSRGESIELLRRRVGLDRVVEAGAAAVDAIIDRCARLPLALAVVAARAATHPDFPLTTVAEDLAESNDALDVVSRWDPGTDLRLVFSWSYRRLGEPVARLFRLLGLHPGTDITAHAAASLASATIHDVVSWLHELSSASLILEHVAGRYVLHDLLRAYAYELATTTDHADEQRSAVGRLLEHYVHAAHAAATLINPIRDSIGLGELPIGVSVYQSVDTAAAFAWFTTERSNLIDCVSYADSRGFERASWQLAAGMVDFFDRRGNWHEWHAVQQIALDAATRSTDRHAIALTSLRMAMVCTALGDFPAAQRHLDVAVIEFVEQGDLAREGRARGIEISMLYRQGRLTEALSAALRTAELMRVTEDRPGLGNTLNTIGWCYAELGRTDEAVDHCKQALQVLRTTAHRLAEGATLDSLGYIHHRAGKYQQAVEHFNEALTVLIEVGNQYLQGCVEDHLADTYAAMGQPERAQAHWKSALQLFTDLGGPEAAAVRDKLRSAETLA